MSRADSPSAARGSAHWRVVQGALLGVVAYFLYRTVAAEIEGVGLAELWRWRPAAAPLALSTLLLLGVYLAHAALWRRILVDLRIATPPARTTVRVYFLASLGRYVPGRLWQLAGLAVLAQRAGLPALPAAASAVLGQVGFLSTGLLFLALVLPARGGGAAVWLAALALLGAAVGGWALLTAGWAQPLREKVRRRLGERPAARRLDAALELADRITPRRALRWFALYALTWVLLGGAFAIFAAAFVPVGAAAVRHLAGTVAASYLAGYVAVFAPAGVIVRELAMMTLLGEVMPGPAALVVAVASRLWFTAAELLPLALLPVLPRSGA